MTEEIVNNTDATPTDTDDTVVNESPLTLKPDERIFKQSDIDAIISREKNKARTSERQAMLTELGFNSVDDLKTTIESYQDTISRLETSQADVQQQLDAYRAEQVQRKRKDALQDKISSLNLAHTDAFYKLADAALDDVFSDDGTLDNDKFNTVINNMREQYPFLFKTRGNDVALSSKSPLGGTTNDSTIEKNKQALIQRMMSRL